MFAKLFLMLALLCCGMCQAAAFQAQDKMYIDSESFKANTKGDEFYIHTGGNVWLITHTINRDATGMFAYESNISRCMKGVKTEYERKWRCPYCFQYWPMGQSCANAACPSKYR